MIFADLNLCARKAYRYVKIIINNDVLAFCDEIVFIFIQYFLLSLFAACNLIIFKNGKVTDVLAKPHNDYRIVKKLFTENLQVCKD